MSWDLISNLRWISHSRKIASLVIENCCWLVPKDKSKEIWKEREKFESVRKKIQHYFMNIKKGWSWDSVEWGFKRLKELKMDSLIVSEEVIIVVSEK
jgi:uncharacterized FlgJ-related protein